jgi:hypothetical protein
MLGDMEAGRMDAATLQVPVHTVGRRQVAGPQHLGYLHLRSPLARPGVVRTVARLAVVFAS